VSPDGFNLGPWKLVVICPLTRADRRFLLHIPIDPPEAGLHYRSFVMVEQVRSIALERLGARLGAVSARTAAAIDDRLRRLFDL